MADFKVNVSEELKNIAKPTTTTLMLWSRLRGLKLLLVLQWGREVDLSMVQSQFFTVKMRSCCNTYLILHSHCTICTIIHRNIVCILQLNGQNRVASFSCCTHWPKLSLAKIKFVQIEIFYTLHLAWVCHPVHNFEIMMSLPFWRLFFSKGQPAIILSHLQTLLEEEHRFASWILS